jgi:hypothetical protein
MVRAGCFERFIRRPAGMIEQPLMDRRGEILDGLVFQNSDSR